MKAVAVFVQVDMPQPSGWGCGMDVDSMYGALAPGVKTTHISINTLLQHSTLALLCVMMSCTRVFIHYVWATKSRKPMLVKPYRQMLFDHIHHNALLKGIHLDRINGYTDHIHCLVWLNPEQSIGKVAQLIKGEAAYWFNHLSGVTHEKLAWQKHYYAASVSLSMLERVRHYIDNQEIHHQKKTFAMECREWEKKYLITKDLENSLAHYKLNTGR